MSKVKVSRILHAGYIFESEGHTLAFDPLFENPFSHNCYAYPNVGFDRKAISELKLDAVIISHYHDDHFSLESLDWLDRSTPLYLFSIFEEMFDYLKIMGFQNVHPIELLRPLHFGPFEILPLKALDEDVDSIYHIKVAGHNILNVVDSWIGPSTFKQLLNTKHWDLVLWPLQTFREIEVLSPSMHNSQDPLIRTLPDEWLEQIQQLKPKALIPSACQFRFEKESWYNGAFFPISYKTFQKQILEILPDVSILNLHPGNSFDITRGQIQKSSPLPWIHPLGVQDVDYDFNPDRAPETISEIAQRLSPLTAEQRDRLQDFYQYEIKDRYAALTITNESYFKSEREWRLTLYNHLGKPTHYQFKVYPDQMINTEVNDNWQWKTEIAETKLYGALENGESLTSVYIRVSPPTGADPLEDPLIRILYEGIVGSYQKAQLRKLGYSAALFSFT